MSLSSLAMTSNFQKNLKNEGSRCNKHKYNKLKVVAIYETGLSAKSQFLNWANKVTAYRRMSQDIKNKGCGDATVFHKQGTFENSVWTQYLYILDTQGDCPWKKEEESCSLCCVHVLCTRRHYPLSNRCLDGFPNCLNVGK